MKKIKIRTKNKLVEIQTIFGNKEKIKQEVKQAIEKIKVGNPQFYCKKCNELFQPKSDQWIFHQLCDSCFGKYDLQKMMGRITFLRTGKSVKYFEDCNEWIKTFKN